MSEENLPILAVDDEEVIRNLLLSVAQTLNLSIEIAPSSEKAKELYNQSTFGLVLTDVVMPGESGLDLCTWLRERDPKLPIIAMSGNLTLTDAKSLEELNVQTFPKPLRLSTLEKALAEFYPHLRETLAP